MAIWPVRKMVIKQHKEAEKNTIFSKKEMYAVQVMQI